MKKLVALGAGLLAMVCVVTFTTAASRKTEKQASSVVKIMHNGGHGSGVNVGNGFVITAAHVVKEPGEYTAVASDGKVVKVRVLWYNETFDIGAVQIEHQEHFKASPLSCSVPKPGQTLRAAGNSLNIDFVTMRGYVAGDERVIGPWKRGVPVDMGIIPGMSGGPVFDNAGRVVGINVGVMLMPMGFAASLTNLGVIVPGRAVCDLIARV